MSLWSTLAAVASAIQASGAQLFDRIANLVGGGEARNTFAFSAAMIALSAKMAKADGVVTSDEEIAFFSLFDIPPGEERNVARVFDLAKQDVAGFETYARRIASLFTEQPETLIDILDGLFHIAKADGYVHEAELAYLERVAEIFSIEERCFQQIRARHVIDGADPYKVLGIERSASDAEVKRQYRRQVTESHPDRLIARGVPEEFVRIANDRMAALNEAWRQVSLERGI
ncbi:DnaJ like chaperone protein [Breoghania corrubedonensis]|uniref:DnaJ like chaperone protein n=1 Tax=Breoghania corrubedonensis TaxID=665038 RepID=A0A2T5V512_9HYPH|nr:DnaJ family molecular chaperone [Breoghania corrubedonensis]PTW58820.1 DnaJ like chaperone protein [Breoghania corrubedonensis]